MHVSPFNFRKLHCVKSTLLYPRVTEVNSESTVFKY